MNNFMTLFKHELKMRFPLKPQKGKRVDILGTALSLLMITFIAAVFIKLLTTPRIANANANITAGEDNFTNKLFQNVTKTFNNKFICIS